MSIATKNSGEPLPLDEETEAPPLAEFELHWIMFAWPVALIFIVLIHVAIVGWIIEVLLGYDTEAALQLPLWLSGMGILVIASGNFCQAVFQRATTKLFVFDDRVIWRRGYFSRLVMTAAIGEIVGVDYGQTYMGRALGYGNVVIETRGSDQIRIARIERPSELAKMVTKLQHARQSSVR